MSWLLTSMLGVGRAAAQVTDIVVVGTRTPESTQKSTIRTGVVSREEAEKRGARNVAEALAGETALQVNPEAYGYLGRPSGVQMQGLDAERVLILEDGERVTGDSGGVVDLSQLPLSGVERIEYVMGPTSSLYGSNALGGVVNVITAAPRRQGASGRGRLEVRSRGELFGDGSLAYRRAELWAVADFGGERDPGLELGNGRPDRLVPERRTRALGLRGGATFGVAELRWKLRWVRDELSGLTSEEVPVLGAYLIDLPETTDRWSLRAQETVRVGQRARLAFSLSQSWFHGRSARDRRSSPIDQTRERSLLTQGLEGTLTIADGADRTWIIGLRSDAERFWQRLERVELSDGALRRRSDDEVLPTQLASGALFGQLAWRQGTTLTLLPGVRAELHDRYGPILAPRLAVAVRPSDRWTLRAALGRGFRAPSAKEYGFIFDHSAIGYRVLGNPYLLPERSWGLNGDAAFRHADWLTLRAGAFVNWVTQLIGTDLAELQANAAVTDYTYVNVARAKTAGADMVARINGAERFQAELGYAHLWTRDESTGSPLPTRPAHTVTAALRGKLGARAEGSVRYRWTSSAHVDEGVLAPAFGALDARASYRFWQDVEAYVGALNLLDEKKDPYRVGDARPALGRSFYIGVSGALPGATEDEHGQH